MKTRGLQLKEKLFLKQLQPKLQPDNWLIRKKLPTEWHLEHKDTGTMKIVSLRSA
ncbi:DUF6906 family protein [Brevibacillus choshinensis]|uniref:DUF6906 family protein n=1 Tax=Brevibacillus choshinensis TaxID=54911 RepID=UPI002E240B59|nr:hypothetical protein [Brevibacillus choshinensis]